MSDRRAMPRVDSLFRVEPLDAGPTLYAQDLSLGGVYVTSPTPRWPGEIFAVRFFLPNQTRAVRATCRVLDLDEAPSGVGMSLRFLKLSTEAALAIHDYVDSRPVVAADDRMPSQVAAWLDRIAGDCGELLAFSRA